MKHDLARELFKSFKTSKIWRPNLNNDLLKRENSDPEPIKNLINQIVEDRNWKQGVAEGSLFTEWNKIVGEEVASHTLPITILDGKLTIQCSFISSCRPNHLAFAPCLALFILCCFVS